MKKNISLSRHVEIVLIHSSGNPNKTRNMVNYSPGNNPVQIMNTF